MVEAIMFMGPVAGFLPASARLTGNMDLLIENCFWLRAVGNPSTSVTHLERSVIYRI